MIKKETRIINNKTCELYFDVERQAYQVAEDAMNLLLENTEKLKCYEDTEEKNLLFRLPCKVGDFVYQLDRTNKKILTKKVQEINIYMGRKTTSVQIMFEIYGMCFQREFGKSVFVNKKDAQQALKEAEKTEGK